jgi:hypothetical protein
VAALKSSRQSSESKNLLSDGAANGSKGFGRPGAFVGVQATKDRAVCRLPGPSLIFPLESARPSGAFEQFKSGAEQVFTSRRKD